MEMEMKFYSHDSLGKHRHEKFILYMSEIYTHSKDKEEK